MHYKKKYTGTGLFLLLIFLAVVFSVYNFDDNTILNKFNILFKYGYIIFIVGIVFLLFIDKNSPEATISWLLVFYTLPFIGFVFYIFMGRSFIKQKEAKNRIDYDFSKEFKVDNYGENNLTKTSKILHLQAKAPIYTHNEVSFYLTGSRKFESLIEDIKNAKHHIHLEYYIFKDDYIGNLIVDELIKKAKQNIEIRFIVDSVGSWRLQRDFITRMRSHGINIIEFSPVLFPVLTRELNYRNHRKIAIIDSKISYIGGINIGDEYLGLSKKFGKWRDSHIRIFGNTSNQIQKVFLNDWLSSTAEVMDLSRYFSKVKSKGDAIIQIASSAPNKNFELIKDAYFNMCNSAEEILWITTPYFVPDSSIFASITSAAKSGVDVRIIIPKKADHFFVYWASRDNIERLLESGVRVFEYINGFIHTKTVLTEKEVSIGSANVDMRSFSINYEINAFLYDQKSISELKKHFINDLKECIEIDYILYKKRSLFRKILEAFARITAPLQ